MGTKSNDSPTAAATAPAADDAPVEGAAVSLDAVKVFDADEAMDSVDERRPPVNESLPPGAIGTASGQQTGPAAVGTPSPGGTAAGPETFDPSIHASVNNDGVTPKYTADGKLAKKRGRKSGGHNSAPGAASFVQMPGTGPGDAAAAARLESAQLGKVTANLIITIGMMVSEDFAPVSGNGVNEAAALEKCWADYYLATGRKDLPPWLGLAVGNLAYIGPRLTREKTRDRLGGFYLRTKAWFSKFRKKKPNGQETEKKTESGPAEMQA